MFNAEISTDINNFLSHPSESQWNGGDNVAS